MIKDPYYVSEVQKSLNKTSISGYFLKFEPFYSTSLKPLRNRGVEGKAEIMMREGLSGDGPGAGILERGKAVVLLGFPLRSSPLHVRNYINSILPLPKNAFIQMIPPR